MSSRLRVKKGDFMRLKEIRNGPKVMNAPFAIRKAVVRQDIKSSTKEILQFGLSEFYRGGKDLDYQKIFVRFKPAKRRRLEDQEILGRRKYAQDLTARTTRDYHQARKEFYQEFDKLSHRRKSGDGKSCKALSRLAIIERRVMNDLGRRRTAARRAIQIIRKIDPEFAFHDRPTIDSTYKAPDVQRYLACIRAFTPARPQLSSPTKQRFKPKSWSRQSKASKISFNAEAVEREVSKAFTGGLVNPVGESFATFNLWRSDLTVNYSTKFSERDLDMPFGCLQNKSRKQSKPLMPDIDPMCVDPTTRTMFDEDITLDSSQFDSGASSPSPSTTTTTPSSPVSGDAPDAEGPAQADKLDKAKVFSKAVDDIKQLLPTVTDPAVKAAIERVLCDFEGTTESVVNTWYEPESAARLPVFYNSSGREASIEKQMRRQVMRILKEEPLTMKPIIVGLLLSQLNPKDMFTNDIGGAVEADFMLSNDKGILRYSNRHLDDQCMSMLANMNNIQLPATYKVVKAKSDGHAQAVIEDIKEGRLLFAFQRAVTEFGQGLQADAKIQWRTFFQEALADAGYVFDNSAHSHVDVLFDSIETAKAIGGELATVFAKSLTTILGVRFPYSTKYGRFADCDKFPARFYTFSREFEDDDEEPEYTLPDLSARS